MSGEVEQRVDGESAETSAKFDRELRSEIVETGSVLFRSMDDERLGIQVTSPTDELDLDPSARPMKESSVEK